MSNRIATWYRTRRWFRWSTDLLAVLILTAVVAVAHTLIFSSTPLMAPIALLLAVFKGVR
jgi:hypothetical protein